MKKSLCKLLAAILAAIVILPSFPIRASSAVTVLQTSVSEQAMLVFTDRELQADVLTCSISGQNAAILSAGTLSDENTAIKTILLLDVSTSMPSNMRTDVIIALKKIIEGKPTNEEFALITFGDELNTLQGFTADRYDIANAIEQVSFDGSQSKLYDAIYNTIPQIAQAEGTVSFYRTVVITDGLDDTVTGITKEELFLKLQNDCYPIDIVAVSTEESAENKDLSAIARISNGSYHTFHPATDVAALAAALNVSGHFYFQAQIPIGLLDGTTRQIDINDSAHSTSIDVKFPAIEISGEPASEPASVSEVPAQSQPTVIPPVEPTTEPQVGWLQRNLGLVITIAVVLLALIGLPIVLAAKSKKKRGDAVLDAPRPPAADADRSSYAKTEMISAADDAGNAFTIKLSNVNNRNKTWELPIRGDILIGRADHCDIQLGDKSVSREQCKITVSGDGLAVTHIGSSNKTSLNGSRVGEACQLQAGDRLEFGREALQIDYIQSSGGAVPARCASGMAGKGDTESIF